VSRPADAQPHVLMIGNNSVPTDRRMWLECMALRDAGMAVSVIAPGDPGAAAHERIDGIEVYRYRDRPSSGRRTGFVRSYASAWLHSAWLAVRIWRRHRFSLVQACNPPDIFFAVAVLFRPFGVRFLFDQHDLSPEIYLDRFPHASRAVVAALGTLERWTHRVAHHVITVNESCKALLVSRTSTPPERLTVVRTGPDLARLVLSEPRPELNRGRKHLCAYLGVMGPQDGVDLIVRAVDVIVHDLGRDDIQFVLMGDGECLAQLTALARELGVERWIDFTGWADDTTISTVLSTSDLGLQPDRRTPFTDLCTMLKTIEYLAFGLPVVAFDLTETHRTAAGAAEYVMDESSSAYARAIVALLDDSEQRAGMSAIALRRARTDLAWENQRDIYVAVVEAVLGINGGDADTHQRGVAMMHENLTEPVVGDEDVAR
jgi:glycosyltransferase involved in cell wall biosynthesis